MRGKRPYIKNLLPATRERARELVVEGKLLDALKLVRNATGVSYREAKEYVDGVKLEVTAETVPAELEARALTMIGQGRPIKAVLVVREAGLSLIDAKKYVDALREGRLKARHAGPDGRLSDRVRAFKAAGDHDSAIAITRAETGMTHDEAVRFVDALE
jgi:ribosomal protein L7/L12